MESDKESKQTQTSDENQLDMVHQGQAHARNLIYAPLSAMVLKCAMDLDIPNIIHSQGTPVSLSRIASHVDGMDEPSPDQLGRLYRVMRFLVGAKVFAAHQPSGNGGETLYGLTPTSELLVKGSPRSMYHEALLQQHELVLSSWLCLSLYVKEGGVSCFHKAHGHDFYDKELVNGKFNEIFNASRSSWTGMIVEAVIEGYKEGFVCLNSLVDVGSGNGTAIAKIVSAYPNIKGINLDLPHVIASAEEHKGVINIGGDMFESIPRADAVFLKNILHNWKDEECINILRNCRRAIPEKLGKIIIIDVILGDEDKGDSVNNEVGFLLDMSMMVQCGGKERSEAEWKKILEAGGFPRYNFIRLPSVPVSIIEAFPM